MPSRLAGVVVTGRSGSPRYRRFCATYLRPALVVMCAAVTRRIAESRDELLARADHLVLAAPSTPRTEHLIGTRELTVVKPGVYLVNIARGALVDQDAVARRAR